MSSDCVTLWIGERLGAVERACLRSVLRQGHRLALYCYNVPAGVPTGIELRDASEILSERALLALCRSRADLYSDWFRYELQRRGLGTWLDTDVYLLSPIDQQRPYLFGEQGEGLINGAILRLPQDSSMLRELLKPFERSAMPPGLPLNIWFRTRRRTLFGRSVDLTRLPWGSTGPHALTAVARGQGLLPKAQPVDVFYPVPWQNADWITDPAIDLDQMVTERTAGVHLWNECIKEFKELPAPRGSFLHRLQEEGK